MPRHIIGSMEKGAFQASSPMVALHVITGVSLAATFAISTMRVDEDYPEQMVHHILLSLGLSRKEADRLVALPLPGITLPEDSLLVRAHN